MKQIQGSFYSGRIEELPHLQGYWEQCKAERQRLQDTMKSLDRRDIGKLPEGEYTVERKIDGIFAMWVGLDNGWYITPGGSVYSEVNSLPAAWTEGDSQIGELYLWSEEGSRERVHPLLSALATGEGLERLNFRRHNSTAVQVNRSLIDNLFEQYMKVRAEGVVIRQVDGPGIWKLKPRMDIDAVIVGYTVQESGNSIKDLMLALVDDKGCLRVLGAVGSGFSNYDRTSLWDRLQSLNVETDRPLIHDGTAVQMVVPSTVVQVSCVDLAAEDSKGNPKLKPAVWFTDEDGYFWSGNKPFVTMTAPYFDRVRDDKRSWSVDCGMKQVTDYVEIPEAPDTGSSAEVLAQIRFEKKEARKQFTLIQTNKPAPGYADYVVHCVDYSPGRAQEIKTEVMVSDSLEQISALYVAAVAAAEGIRGWEKGVGF